MADSPKIPLKNDPMKTNWVEQTGALKPHATNWIYRAAEHLKGKGRPESEAIPIAVDSARRICKTGDTNLPGVQQVHAAKRADACAAVLKWDAARARAKANNLSDDEAVMRAIDLAGPRLARGLDLTDSQREVLDLAFVKTPLGKMPQARLKGLYDIAATVKRLRKSPRLKNLSDAQLQQIAAARILRRQVRNRLGITDLKQLPPGQLKQLEKAGLVGGGKAKLGTVVSYTLQRGPRKGQTIQIRRTASGWHEVKPHQTKTAAKAA